ncbi:Long-chain-fatty-acid--CoA ligase 1 [Bagarius yarrelli]|uniref:long-chain-fatty-acid--CoA ligase n=1 Tax=Bagarius yarrelli TaxID=175774 RepID=A0A556UFR5_BAGYA|nr:Long-chain-fatty-acid--CoA ligase 1 [Bagarius yarrelli]
MGTLRDLQFALQLKIEELRQRDALIDELELELDAKDDLIRRLQGELDRLRITLSGPASATGQHHASSVRLKRRSVLTEPTNLDLNLILQNPPMSHSKNQESQRVIETTLMANDWLKYIGTKLSDLVDCAYPTTAAQGARLIQEGDEASQAFVLEGVSDDHAEEQCFLHHSVCGCSPQVRVLERCSVSEDSVCVSVLSRGDSFGDRALKGSVLRFVEASMENGSNEPKDRTADEGDGPGHVSLSEVLVLCNVGEGRYSRTQLVHLKNDTSRVFVLKVINKHVLLTSGNRSRILTEKQILMDARCPFIVRGPFDESTVRFYTVCVLEALRFLHGQGFVHRDLKPENVLLDQKGHAKLAPEIILHKGHGVMVDFWAVGVFVYELLNGSPPFIGSDQLKTYAAVLKGIDAVEFPEAISSPAADFIKHLCSSDAVDFRALLPSLALSPPSLLGFGAVASLTAYWLVTRPRSIRPPCDLSAQSIPVQGDPNCRRSALIKDDNLLDFYFEDIETVYNMFQRGLRITGDGPCLGFRKPGKPYQWISYTEWVITELACYFFSMAVVPLYETLGLEAMVHILNLAEISLVVCDKQEKAESLLSNKENGLTPTLSCLVLFNPVSATLVERGRKCGVEILQLEQLMDLGRENLQAPVPPRPQDLAVVCFTSGTTGKPKGAMITHGNITANASSVSKILEGFFEIRQDDVSISYLPLAHMFERMIEVSMFCHGASVGFYQGDISLLMDDIKTLKPTFFPVVPRLLNRIYDKIQGSVTSVLKRAILHYAVSRKQAELSSGIVRNDSVWDRLIFNKIQIFEGYGQTECTAGCHVGAPLPCSMVKLTDIPDMNYYTQDGQGEICIRGPSVFQGYLRDEERTAEALDSEGWLHTGDVGQWLPNGTLRIIDRKKNIFKLSQGEYIAPEKIENSYLIGIVVPDPEVFVNWAKERGIVGLYEELCQNPVKDLYLHPEMFSVNNGLLTPTLKSKRGELQHFFREQIARMYGKSAA